MKILIIGTTASSIYHFRKEFITALIKKNHIVYALTCEDKKQELKKIRELDAIPISYKLNRGGLNPLEDIQTIFELARRIKKISPDIVFSYFIKPVIFGSLAARIARVPKVVGMLEGLGYAFTEQPEGLSNKTKIIKSIQIALYRVALPQLDELIFLNRDDPEELLEKHSIKAQSMHVLGGIGLNLEEYAYQPSPNTKVINFLFIGRLLKEKGIHEFVAAAKLVKHTYPNVTFTILGAVDNANPGALKKAELEHLIASGIITYPGYVDNITHWIANSHIFVLPSYREGVPRSTQEAMAIGRPIITTDVPGCRETVIDGRNGFLVEKWNPDALAKKMIYFIENPEKIEQMGLESYKIAQEKYDANKVNKRLLKILGVKI